jgi:hypothetical protein
MGCQYTCTTAIIQFAFWFLTRNFHVIDYSLKMEYMCSVRMAVSWQRLGLLVVFLWKYRLKNVYTRIMAFLMSRLQGGCMLGDTYCRIYGAMYMIVLLKYFFKFGQHKQDTYYYLIRVYLFCGSLLFTSKQFPLHFIL